MADDPQYEFLPVMRQGSAPGATVVPSGSGFDAATGLYAVPAELQAAASADAANLSSLSELAISDRPAADPPVTVSCRMSTEYNASQLAGYQNISELQAQRDAAAKAMPPQPSFNKTRPAHVYTEVGEPLAASIIVSGIPGQSYLNREYHRIQATVYDEKPVYRSLKQVAPGNGTASGQYFYLHFHARHNAWALTMQLGSNGIAAYWRNPANLNEPLGTSRWKVSNEVGTFIPADVVCCAGLGPLVKPDGTVVEGDTSAVQNVPVAPKGTQREDAHAMLKKACISGAPIGTYAIRISTSKANTFVLSVINPARGISHIRVDSGQKTVCLVGYPMQHLGLQELINFHTLNKLPVEECRCVLKDCLVGQDHATPRR